MEITTEAIDIIEYKNGHFATVYKLMINKKHLGYMFCDAETGKTWYDVFSPLAPNAQDIGTIKGSENGYYCHSIKEINFLFTNKLIG